MKNPLRNKMQWTDFRKEWHIPFTKSLFQFEIIKSAPNSIKHITPSVGFTRRKKICLAFLFFVWDRRILCRFVWDVVKADKSFGWNKRIK